MSIVEFLKLEYIIPDLSSKDKQGSLRELSKLVHACHPEVDVNAVLGVLTAREELGSTGIGEGIAIPHGKMAGIDQVVLSFGRSREGIPFGSLDGKPAHIFFLILAPENSNGIHLKLLANISRLLREKDVRDRLMRAKTREEMLTVIAESDSD